MNYKNYFDCYKDIEGYYLDKNESLFKKCYKSCYTCEIKGNNLTHNCLQCNNNFPIKVNHSNYFNCYKECTYYHFFDKENYYHCTINSSCPEEYPELIEEKNECIKYDIKDSIDIMPKYEKNSTEEIIKYEKNSTEKITKEEEIKYYDNILHNIESDFTSEYYDTSNLDSGENEVLIETDKIKVTLTTTQNQINNTNDNMTSIDLGQCETLLRNHYNISDDKLLYMKKIDVAQEGLKIPKVEFDIYCKLNGSNLIKLNKTICKDSKISLSVPVIITEDKDKLDTNGEYYNDKCKKLHQIVVQIYY